MSWVVLFSWHHFFKFQESGQSEVMSITNNSTSNEYSRATRSFSVDTDLLDKILFRIQLWRIAHGYVLLPMCILGIIGNVVCIIVLNRKSVRSSTVAVYLRCLAVTDLLVLTTAIFRYRCYKLFLNDEREIWSIYHFDPYVQVYVEPIHWIALGVSSFITLMLSMERYLAVRYPLKIKQRCSTTLVWCLILLLIIVASLITIPNFFAYTVEAFQINNITTVAVAKLTEMGTRTLYHCSFHNYVIPFVWYIIPWILLAVFSILLSRHVRKSNKIRPLTKTGALPNRSVTILIITIVLVYMACNFPNCILVFYSLVHHTMEHNLCTHETQGLTSKTSKTHDVIEVIGELLNVLNSCINIALYCLVGTNFRKELKKFVICQGFKGKMTVTTRSQGSERGTSRSPLTSRHT